MTECIHPMSDWSVWCECDWMSKWSVEWLWSGGQFCLCTIQDMCGIRIPLQARWHCHFNYFPWKPHYQISQMNGQSVSPKCNRLAREAVRHTKPSRQETSQQQEDLVSSKSSEFDLQRAFATWFGQILTHTKQASKMFDDESQHTIWHHCQFLLTVMVFFSNDNVTLALTILELCGSSHGFQGWSPPTVYVNQPSQSLRYLGVKSTHCVCLSTVSISGMSMGEVHPLCMAINRLNLWDV